ncbi:hypothetical protein RB195_001918 [Necator americanus]|uniref:TIL domain-containing protein n=1 Tax=Necator americanus TaxID=51031 RepID=A0ABR1DGI0_NECAM
MRPLELTVITFLVVTLFVTSSSAARNCGTNEVYDSCVNPNCYGTCGNLYPSCPRICGKGGCRCQQGYVRKSKGGPCVHWSQC